MAGTSIFAGIPPSFKLIFIVKPVYYIILYYIILYYIILYYIILYYISLGPGSVVGGKGKKRDETGRKSQIVYIDHFRYIKIHTWLRGLGE